MKRQYPLLRAVCITAALVIIWACVALATVPSKPYTFNPNTLIQSSQVNADFDTLYAAFNANIDHSNMGSAGIWASDLKPTTAAGATFGGSLAYIFPAGIEGSTGTLTVYGTGASDPFVVRDLSNNVIFDVANSGLYVDQTLNIANGKRIVYTGGTANVCARFDVASILQPASIDCMSAVTASAPLASSGGSAPNISLTGTVPVANGGTNLTSLTGARCMRSAGGGAALAEAAYDCLTVASPGGTQRNGVHLTYNTTSFTTSASCAVNTSCGLTNPNLALSGFTGLPSCTASADTVGIIAQADTTSSGNVQINFYNVGAAGSPLPSGTTLVAEWICAGS